MIQFKIDTTRSGSTGATQFLVPFTNFGTYSCTIDWGDSSSDVITAWNQAQATHTYATGGVYTVTVTGTCQGFKPYNHADRNKITEFITFSCAGAGITSMSDMFRDMTHVASFGEVVDTSAVTSFQSCWYGCSGMTATPDTSNWDTSSVTSFAFCWLNCSGMTLPPDTSNWDTSAVTSFAYCWQGCSGMISPPDTSNWDTSSVISFQNCWFGCSGMTATPDTSGWDTSSVTSFQSCWYGCSGMTLPPDTSNWDTSSVISFQNCWQNCTFQPVFYDSLLVGLANSNPRPNVPMHGGSSKYTPHGKQSRDTLQGLGWTITDGGPATLRYVPAISPTIDALGNPLDYSGRVPFDGLLVGSPCITLDGTNDYVSLPASINGENLHSFRCRFYTDTDITSATVERGLAKWDVSGGGSFINFGGWTTAVTNEVITIGQQATTTHRTSVVDITISAGWHELEVVWNSGQSRYDIILDGVTQSVTAGTSTHTPMQTIVSDGIIGLGFSGISYYAFRLADIEIKSDASTTILHLPCSDQYGDYLTNRVDPDNSALLVGHTLSASWANVQDEFHVTECDVVPWFNGSTSKIVVANANWTEVSAGFTFSCLARVDSFGSTQHLLGNLAQLQNRIYVNTDGSVQFNVGGSTLGTDSVKSSSGVVTLGQWFHLVLTWNGSTVVATVDSVEVINQSVSTPVFSSGSFQVGTRNSSLDVLTGAIASISMSGAFTYDCDQGSNTFTDTSGNGNNGTGSNLTWLTIPTQTDGSSTVGRLSPTNNGAKLVAGMQTGVLRSGGIDSVTATRQGWSLTTPWVAGDGAEISPNVHLGESDGPYYGFYSFNI